MTEIVDADVVQASPRPDPLPEGLKVGQPGTYHEVPRITCPDDIVGPDGDVPLFVENRLAGVLSF